MNDKFWHHDGQGKKQRQKNRHHDAQEKKLHKKNRQSTISKQKSGPKKKSRRKATKTKSTKKEPSFNVGGFKTIQWQLDDQTNILENQPSLGYPVDEINWPGGSTSVIPNDYYSHVKYGFDQNSNIYQHIPNFEDLYALYLISTQPTNFDSLLFTQQPLQHPFPQDQCLLSDPQHLSQSSLPCTLFPAQPLALSVQSCLLYLMQILSQPHGQLPHLCLSCMQYLAQSPDNL